MSIWDIDIGWFMLGAFFVCAIVIISIERICWKQKRDTYITKELDEARQLLQYGCECCLYDPAKDKECETCTVGTYLAKERGEK